MPANGARNNPFRDRSIVDSIQEGFISLFAAVGDCHFDPKPAFCFLRTNYPHLIRFG